MNILYIWDADYPWDVRVEKICKTLAGAGHNLHIAARNLNRRPEYEQCDDFTIHRLKARKYDRVNYALSFPAFFSPIWGRFLNRIIRAHHIDLIFVRDLPMAIAGIWAGKRHAIPVVFDMAEDYVALIWDIWRVRKFQGLNLVVRNPYFAGYVEKYVLRESSHILVVVDEARDIVIKKGADPEKVTIVGNTPPLAAFQNLSCVKNDSLDAIGKRYSVVYTGGIQMGRGLQIVFDAIPEIIKTIPDFLFVIVGDGYARAHLEDLARRKQVQDYVKWVGWVEHEKMFDYVKACRVGIIPHFTSAHVNTTIPNKIFDYMALGLPVLSSDATPLKRITEQEKCGMVFKNGDASDLSRAMAAIYESKVDFGQNGIDAVNEKYNWALDARRLNQVVDAVRC